MANARVPAAVVVNLLNEEVDLNQLTPRKRTRAQLPLRTRGLPARQFQAAAPNGHVPTIVLDDEPGGSHNNIVIDPHDLARIRGKAPMQERRPSKRGRGGFLDLTGDEDSPQAQGNRAAHGLEGPLVAASSSLISDDEDAYLALEGEDAQRIAAFDERPGPSWRAAEGEDPPREVPGHSEDVVPEPWPSLQEEFDQPIDVSGSQQDPDEMGVGPVLQRRETTFSCAVCYDEHSMEDCFIASMCRHRLCRDAAREVVLGAIKSCTFPVLCPICQAKSDPPCAKCERRRADLERAAAAGEADKEGANGAAAWCCSFDADITLLLCVEEEEQYLARSLKAATNASPDLLPCQKADCDGVAVAGGEDASPHVVCNVCQHGWCKTCNAAWHHNLSCDEYQRQVGEAEADKGLREYQAANKMIRCPTCGHGIEKITGCNRVQCTGCKTQVCWLCGLKLPATNPYSHFTSKGCPSVGGGEAHKGGGVPAGAWAGVQAVPGTPPAPAPAPRPMPAAELAANVRHAAAPQAAGAAGHHGNPLVAAAGLLAPPRNRRAHRHRRERG
ncbi:hypothetical protein WJX75_008551 [Coccomyxa subellipsoidea]|uniref:RBR-type E3 ubiquitin transferase n=1 Tax=Coccomyxa subellipsoidea TaxID=248742 RepID=A0ABR2YBP8_9CHLO